MSYNSMRFPERYKRQQETRTPDHLSDPVRDLQHHGLKFQRDVGPGDMLLMDSMLPMHGGNLNSMMRQ
jgi:hypothetical protein